jgi:RNA 3'-terminal phosphate cyclase-like protein
MIEAARGVLNPMAGDIYIYSEVSTAHFLRSADTSNIGIAKIGLGFGLSLVAESSTGVLCSTDVACPPSGGQTPEDIGHQCAFQLLDTLSCGGTVSLAAAPTVLTLMAMGLEDVGRLRMGREILATEEIIGLGRDLRAFGASGWRIRDDATGMGGEVIVSVVGRGIVSIGRRMI